MRCSCGAELLDISGHMSSVAGNTTSVLCCIACGGVAPSDLPSVDELEAEARGTLVDEAESDGAIKSFFKRAYEVGFVMGSAAAIKELRDRATNKGRVRRIRALWPPKEQQDFDEIQALLEMGD